MKQILLEYFSELFIFFTVRVYVLVDTHMFFYMLFTKIPLPKLFVTIQHGFGREIYTEAVQKQSSRDILSKRRT